MLRVLQGSGFAGVAVNEQVGIPAGQCEELSQLTLFAKLLGSQFDVEDNWEGLSGGLFL